MTAPPRDPDRAAAEAALAAEGSERMTLPERHVELHPGRHGWARHAEQGNCSCGFPAREGKRKCQFCVDYIKGYRDKRSAAGLCRGHGNPVLPGRKKLPALRGALPEGQREAEKIDGFCGIRGFCQ